MLVYARTWGLRNEITHPERTAPKLTVWKIHSNLILAEFKLVPFILGFQYNQQNGCHFPGNIIQYIYLKYNYFLVSWRHFIIVLGHNTPQYFTWFVFMLNKVLLSERRCLAMQRACETVSYFSHSEKINRKWQINA